MSPELTEIKKAMIWQNQKGSEGIYGKIKAFTNEVIQKVAEDNHIPLSRSNHIWNLSKCEKGKIIETKKR